MFSTHSRSYLLDLLSQDSPCLLKQLLATALLYAAVNFTGTYTKYLTDRSQRKAFLETHRSTETRFKTQKENEQQEKLLLSGNINISNTSGICTHTSHLPSQVENLLNQLDNFPTRIEKIVPRIENLLSMKSLLAWRKVLNLMWNLENWWNLKWSGFGLENSWLGHPI